MPAAMPGSLNAGRRLIYAGMRLFIIYLLRPTMRVLPRAILAQVRGGSYRCRDMNNIILLIDHLASEIADGHASITLSRSRAHLIIMLSAKADGFRPRDCPLRFRWR